MLMYTPKSDRFKSLGHTGFTIVELLIVIVVIAILAAIVIIAYNGIRERSVISAMSSDLKNAATQLELERAETGAYSEDDTGLPKSNTTTYQYDWDNSTDPPFFCLTATSSLSSTAVYHISSANLTPTEGACDGHHGPIAYEYEFTVSGGSNSSSSRVDMSYSWDSETIGGLEYQRYLLYESCTGPNVVIESGPPHLISNEYGTGTSFLSWGNISQLGHDSIASLWVRVRPVDSSLNPLAGWSQGKGVSGRYDEWTTCVSNQSPWANPPAISARMTGATVTNLAGSEGTYRGNVTHYAKTTAPQSYFDGTNELHFTTATSNRVRYEKIFYQDSGCIGATPASPNNPATGSTSFGIYNNHPKPSVTGIGLSNMRTDSIARAVPRIGAVWARVMAEDSNGNSLSGWSEPYGVITVWDLDNEETPVTLDVCPASSPPPANHWPSAQ